MIKRNLKLLNKSQSGYASFVIALITMIVVSLIVVGFASDSRLEQKDSLANILGSQAYYAAESGINDAYTIIKTDVNSGLTPPTSSTCATSGGPYIPTSDSNQLDSGLINYTCLEVNPLPNSLAYPSLVPGEGQVLQLTSSNGAKIGSVTFSWQSDSQVSGGALLSFVNCPDNANKPGLKLPSLTASTSPTLLSADKCGAGVLQLDLVSNSALVSDYKTPATTVFLEPVKNSGAAKDTPQTAGSQVQTYYVECSSTPVSGDKYACSQTINLASPDSTYYLNMQAFYQTDTVSVTAEDTSGNSINFSGSQIVIDSTGYANGQLKRLQERVCYGTFCGGGTSSLPDAAVESTQCIDKQFKVYPGDTDTTTPADC